MKKIRIILMYILVLNTNLVLSQYQINEVFLKNEQLHINSILHNPTTLDSVMNIIFLNSGKIKSYDEQIKAKEETIFQNKKVLINGFGLGAGIGFIPQDTSVPNEYIDNPTPRIAVNISIKPKEIFLRKSEERKLRSEQMNIHHIQQEQKIILKKELINLLYNQLLIIDDLFILIKQMNENEALLKLVVEDFNKGNIDFKGLSEYQAGNNIEKKQFNQLKYQYLVNKSNYELMIKEL